MNDERIPELQETGRTRLLGERSLSELLRAVDDLGLDPKGVTLKAEPFNVTGPVWIARLAT